MRKFGVLMGLGAALLLCLGATAQEPGADGGASKSRFQRGRSRGFGGFPDWDSRRGSYDRSRRQDSKDQDKKSADKDRGGPERREAGPGDRRGGPPSPPAARGGRRGFGPPGIGPRGGPRPSTPPTARDGDQRGRPRPPSPPAAREGDRRGTPRPPAPPGRSEDRREGPGARRGYLPFGPGRRFGRDARPERDSKAPARPAAPRTEERRAPREARGPQRPSTPRTANRPSASGPRGRFSGAVRAVVQIGARSARRKGAGTASGSPAHVPAPWRLALAGARTPAIESGSRAWTSWLR